MVRMENMYNSNLVVRKEYDGDVGLIKQYVTDIQVETGEYKYTVSVLSTDIEKNKDVLLACFRKLADVMLAV